MHLVNQSSVTSGGGVLERVIKRELFREKQLFRESYRGREDERKKMERNVTHTRSLQTDLSERDREKERWRERKGERHERRERERVWHGATIYLHYRNSNTKKKLFHYFSTSPTRHLASLYSEARPQHTAC